MATRGQPQLRLLMNLRVMLQIMSASGLFLVGLLGTDITRSDDWPQWCGSDGKNMVSSETGLPESFVPGKKHRDGSVDLSTATNVTWGVKIGTAFHSTPSVAMGKVFVGGLDREEGILVCFDAATGKRLWQWRAPAREVPDMIDGFSIGLSTIPQQIGVCSSPAIENDRLYFVSNRCDLMCLDVECPGEESEASQPRVVWSYDMLEQLGVFPCDASNGSPLIVGDLLYVTTCNGVDRNTFGNPAKEKERKIPAPDAPNLIVVDKRDGRLVATDDAPVAKGLLHGQWSSPSLGKVGNRTLIFYGGGDGVCYAFEALTSAPEDPVRLKTVWSYDCVPPEYKAPGEGDEITHYCLGDQRVQGTLNKDDGTFVGRSQIIATPVFVNDRVYLAIGRDPAHGRGRGALHCIDARGEGDITASGKIWTYQGLDRSLSTASVADGLVYVSDVGGRLHCVDADTGHCHWIHDTQCETWGSTLVADGKIYMPTTKGLWVLAAGKELKILSHITLGGRVYASPVAANGMLYVATTQGWLWAASEQ
ncbi:MAG: outer membrane protein assembly factor BamB family protein [Pirellulaceae bacterium]